MEIIDIFDMIKETREDLKFILQALNKFIPIEFIGKSMKIHLDQSFEQKIDGILFGLEELNKKFIFIRNQSRRFTNIFHFI